MKNVLTLTVAVSLFATASFAEPIQVESAGSDLLVHKSSTAVATGTPIDAAILLFVLVYLVFFPAETTRSLFGDSFGGPASY